MKYCTILGEGNCIEEVLTQLDKSVNQKLKKGWKPQGGVTIIGKDYHPCYACQTMIKDENNSKRNNNCC